MNSAQAHTPEDIQAWLRLLMTPGVGPATQRQLLHIWQWPTAIFESSLSDKRVHLSEALALALHQEPPELKPTLERTMLWLESTHCHLLTMGSDAYPASLLQTADPPVCLFAQGNLACLQNLPWLAIVGSRNPTPQGVANARAFARAFAEQGLGVVSGLALGVDGAAHEGALAGKGPTIAVVGTGLDRVYPKAHHALAHQIAETGLLLSEYVLGSPPLAAHFPQRNRIISGLSAGVLVVEATLQSGSLITARLAGDQGREVFAIPGSIHSPQSKGCHALIRQGAKLVESATDVLEELGWSTQAAAQVARSPSDSEPRRTPHPTASALVHEATDLNLLTPEAQAMLDAMGHEVTDIDELLAQTGATAAIAQAVLMELEINGQVARLPGARWQRVI
jgi:DNA processing protein